MDQNHTARDQHSLQNPTKTKEEHSSYSLLRIVIPLVLGLFAIFTFASILARSIAIDSQKPFPTWTYNSDIQALNVWTSWDSGFYYEIAKNGYPKLKTDIPSASIEVPAGTWVKVFLGGGVVGEERFALPFSTPDRKVNNTVFLIGKPFEDSSVTLYEAYAGIPYCVYKGPILFERDVRPAAQSLIDPLACGESACDRTYVTYFSAQEEKVVYQEYMSRENPEPLTPMASLEGDRPSGFDENTYEGAGCKEIAAGQIQKSSSIDYQEQFTVFPFMPLYPMLAKMLGFVVGDVVFAGLLISLLSFVASSLYLYRFLQNYVNPKVARYSVFTYVLFPFAFYNMAFLAVGLFNLLLFATLFYAKNKQPWLSMVLIVLLVLTNWYGLFILIPLFFIFQSNNGEKGNGFKYFFPAVVFGLLPLLAHMLYLAGKTGDLFTLFTSRKPWYGDAETFIGSFANYFMNFDIYVAFEVVTFSVVTALAFLGVKKMISSSKDVEESTLDQTSSSLNHGGRKEMISLLVIFLLLPIFGGGAAGILKYSLIVIPFFSFIGSFLSEKSPGFRLLIFVLLLVFSVVMVCLWSISSRFVV